MNSSTIEIRYRWKLLRAGPLWLDGGGMFGIVPRALWNRIVRCDEQGRIELAHNCLLLQQSNDDAGSPRRIIIEVGSGNKFSSKFRNIYGLSDRSIIDALDEVDCLPEQVDAVIVTHLHFDHAGGLTRLAKPGEMPDWTPAGGDSPESPAVKRNFPNARIFVQQREWEDAIANRSTMTRTYLQENLEPIHPQLQLIESPVPFSPGYLPLRDEMPAAPISNRQTEILPGIHAFVVPGHTWGQQAVRFVDDRGRIIVFTPDILPTIHHVGATYNMAYDVEPFISTVTRRWFLEAAAQQDWLLVLDHEPGNPCQRARPDGKGWFKLEAEGGIT